MDEKKNDHVTPSPGIDQVGRGIGPEDDLEQNAALPDWGPTDGRHGTDAEKEPRKPGHHRWTPHLRG